MAKLTNSFEKCAGENGYCKCNGYVGYGPTKNNTFKMKHVTGGVHCKNNVFGDVNPGVIKRCECLYNGEAYKENQMATLTNSFKKCAGENGHCKCNGYVGYGPTKNKTFKMKYVTGGVHCKNNIFGDVNPGVIKRCECLYAKKKNGYTLKKLPNGC